MSIKQRVIAQFEQLVAKGPESLDAVVQPATEKGYIVGIPAGEGEEEGTGASLNLADYDRYSAALRYLEVFNKNISMKPDQVENYLQQVAAEISQRLTYLEEPLTLIELSTIDNVAQLRSTPPEQATDQSTYWEVSVKTTPHPHARLTRYRWVANSPQRIVVTYPATFAILGRLAEDLATSLLAMAETAG